LVVCTAVSGAPGRRHGQQAGQLKHFLALDAMERKQIEI
jgi:hypothetical protein